MVQTQKKKSGSSKRALRRINDRLKYTNLLEYTLRFENGKLPGRQLLKAGEITTKIYGAKYVVDLYRVWGANPTKFGFRANPTMFKRWVVKLFHGLYLKTNEVDFVEYMIGTVLDHVPAVQQDFFDRLDRLKEEGNLDHVKHLMKEYKRIYRF
ncbi:MAG: hypothetical protein JSW23_01550 [Planctomycetota bacterium]|nr:MAG: hypothetical protein JSW23_01550 [Planctomycetota bacterium]